MPLLQALALGALQGLTEFVPISSSGHLVLVPEALGWEQPGLAFVVLLHAASLLALIVYFGRELVELLGGIVRRDRRSLRLLGLLLVGTLPAALAGVLLGDYFEGTYDDAKASAVQLVVTALILVAAEQLLAFHTKRRRDDLREMEELHAGDAATIGLGQAISILPGISRSGATIAAGLGLRMKRDAAARFAFLLALPALLGASVVEIPELGEARVGMGEAAAGFVASLVASYLAIWGLIRYLRTKTLYPFAAYCLVAGIAFYALV